MNKKLKEIRQAKGLSQSKLAEKTGISIRTIQHYEQGAKDFNHARIDTILKVCVTLNCKLEEIIDNPDYIELMKKLPN